MTHVDLFDYNLPEELIAAAPSERRDESRLLCLERDSGGIAHRRFSDLPALLGPGDLLVVNDARVIPARLSARRATGGRIEVLLVRPCAPDGAAPNGQAASEAVLASSRTWLAMLNGGKALRKGELLSLEWPDADLQLQDRRGGYWVVSLEDPAVSMEEILQEGAMPLPPYVLKARRRRGMSAELADLDRERYQTVYARAPGAIAAPTAGLHFTEELLAAVEAKGVLVRPLTLLVGPGTFRPVKTERAEDHVLEPEFYHLPADTTLDVERALSEGRRVIATGTTCCRVLEYVARKAHWQEHGGWTDLYIYPPFEFKVVRALITNFHLPRSTLLMLVCAFAGRDKVLNAYRIATEQEYRFYSYGDAMFIH